MDYAEVFVALSEGHETLPVQIHLDEDVDEETLQEMGHTAAEIKRVKMPEVMVKVLRLLDKLVITMGAEWEDPVTETASTLLSMGYKIGKGEI